MVKASNEPTGVRRARIEPKTRWQLQTAKARFSEVFRRARTEGPQLITRQGREGVVMISDEQYNELVGTSHQPASLLEFFRASPLVGLELDLKRNKEQSREIVL
jgi:prevent-host-death family protein